MGFYENCPGCYKNFYVPQLDKCVMCPYKKRTPLPSFEGSPLLFIQKCKECRIRPSELGISYCAQCKTKRLH